MKKRGIPMKVSVALLGCFLVFPTILNAQTTEHMRDVRFIDANTAIACGTNGTIIRSVNGGGTWTTISAGTGHSLHDIEFVSPSVGVIVGGNSATAPPILRTNDGGNTWATQLAPLSSGLGSVLRSVSCADANVWYAAGRYDKIVRTTDGGGTWHVMPNITSESVSIYGIHFNDASTGIAVGGSIVSPQTIFRTTNSGTSWASLPVVTNTLNDVAFVTATTGYAVGNVATVLRTMDGGLNWTTMTSGATSSTYQAASFVDANIGYAVGWAGVIAKTTNGGASWTTQSSGTTRDLYGVAFKDANTGIAVGAYGTILHTTNGGATWYDPQLPIQLGSLTGTFVGGTRVRLDWMTLSEINNYGFEVQRTTDLSIPFSSLPNSFIPGNGTTLVPQYYTFTDSHALAGRQFYRLKQMDLGGPVHYTDPIAVDVLAGLAESIKPHEMFLKQNYPNPFNPVTNFRFSIPTSQLTVLRIFDLLGREVATLLDDVLPSGDHSAVWDASGFASGLYMARLESGGKVQMRKVALLR